MSNRPNVQPNQQRSRRDFLKTSSAAAMAGSLALAHGVHAGGGETLRVGLVGCGGRGTGAAANALNADPGAKLVAMADVFDWRIDGSLAQITTVKPGQVAVDADHRFVGFDACERLLASGVDVVLITVPSYFTPIYLKAAIDAGKHVFCEKTHAVDAPGVKMVLETTDAATRKGLSVVAGLAWRYDTGVVETMKRVHDGAIGEIVAVQETCNTGSLRALQRKPGMSEMAYQIYNWYNFNWLSADLPGLNLVHNLDKGTWAVHDEPPVRAWGMGGRQVRDEPIHGDVYDHHATVFEYANGVRMHAYCRQQNGCQTEVSDKFQGTKGRCDLLGGRIEGETNWRYGGPECNRFDLEHVALFSSIRSGKPISDGVHMARSSLMALMCTQCSYTGRVITWDEAMNSQQRSVPERLAMDAPPPVLPDAHGRYPIPVPGVTEFR